MRKHFVFAGAGIFVLAAGTAMAFHGGGVGHCDGCHSMHNSPENPVMGIPGGTLLRGSDSSSTCLNCHDGTGSYHVNSADGSNVKEGGDFYWVLNPYTVEVLGVTNTYGGDNAGHNVVAFDFGMTADTNPDNATAPGGTYSSTMLGCTSCHDAHGQILGGTAAGQLPISMSGSYAGTPPPGSIKGNFRLLGDSMYEAGDESIDNFSFTYDAPVALTNGPTGEWTRYGSGMSEWCANCHSEYLDSASKHPVSEPLDDFIDNYNFYIKTGDFTGTQASSYDDLVPFETGATDQSTLVPQGITGPVAGAQVMCLTCHRAHASAHNNSGRWDFEVEFLALSNALESPDVPVTAAVYYQDGLIIDVATHYGEFQRSLCNKCHVQD